MIHTGRAVGVGVAIIEGDSPAQFFSYGNAVARAQSTRAQAFSPDMLFNIG
jgi:hypothetical protein